MMITLKSTALGMLGVALAVAQTPPEPQPAGPKFSCASLVINRIDPLVDPGVPGTPHLHQIMGGNAFNATMDPSTDPAALSTCTAWWDTPPKDLQGVTYTCLQTDATRFTHLSWDFLKTPYPALRVS